MSDTFVIKDDEELITLAKDVYEGIDHVRIIEILYAMRTFIIDHRDNIRASVYDEVIDLLQEKRDFTRMEDVKIELGMTLLLLRPQSTK